MNTLAAGCACGFYDALVFSILAVVAWPYCYIDKVKEIIYNNKE
jgi:hypothetical protein